MIKNIVKNGLSNKVLLTFVCSIIFGSYFANSAIYLPITYLLAFILVYLMIRSDLILLITLITITCQVINVSFLPIFSFGGASVHVKDLILILGLIKVCYNHSKKSGLLLQDNIGKRIFYFYFYAIFILLLSIILLRINFNESFRFFRIISYYLTYFIIVGFLKSRDDLRKFFNILECFSVIVGLQVILQAFFGRDLIFLAGRVENLRTLGETTKDVTRISTEGMVIVGIIFWYELMHLFLRPQDFRFKKQLIFLISSICLVVSFYRSEFLSRIICFIIFLPIILSKVNRYQLLIQKIFVISAVTILIYVPFSLMSVKVQRYQSGFFQRIESLFEGERLVYDESLTIRYKENEVAIKQLSKSPFIGIGMGNEYRDRLFYENDSGAWIHNGYLAILLNFGLIGLVLFGFIYFNVFRLAYKYARERSSDWYITVVSLTVILSLTSYLIVSFVGPAFVRLHSIIAISILFSIPTIIRKIKQKNG